MTHRIGILGGTFDPPHNGHVELARAGMHELALNSVLFVPANIPPHKRTDSADTSARLEMTRLAACEVPGAAVSDMELSRGGVSYTVDTLRQLRLFFPGDELVFLCGSDMFLTLHNWRRHGEILSMCRIAAAARYENTEQADMEAHAERLRSEFSARVTLLKKPVLEIASTDLRRNPDSPHLPRSVRDYIKKQGLYLR